MAGNRATFGQRAAVYLISKSHEGADLDPTLAFVRSAGSRAVAPVINRALQHNVIAKLADWLGGYDAEQRAALIVSHMAGFDLMGRIAKAGALGPEHLEALAPRFARVLQAYVDDAM
ncbi:MAG: hypothetical protein MPJ78_01640 [Hyphomicrobiaceae bacterium]|nr:hypothetical protein [Hyphomicrobiaceae bacterium]